MALTPASQQDLAESLRTWRKPIPRSTCAASGSTLGVAIPGPIRELSHGHLVLARMPTHGRASGVELTEGVCPCLTAAAWSTGQAPGALIAAAGFHQYGRPQGATWPTDLQADRLGMTALHRVGLAGLYMTLDAFDRDPQAKAELSTAGLTGR